MNPRTNDFAEASRFYLKSLNGVFTEAVFLKIEKLAYHLRKIWEEGNNLFICGNGGSAANAIHMANDFHYGAGACGAGQVIKGLKVEALPSNIGVVTCLANDIGYENIYSHQLTNKANTGDVLIVLSGSGNSKNICNVLNTAKKLGVYSYAILGYDGGKCLELADFSLHFQINDMQISEDTQLIVGHLCMQWLTKNKPSLNR